MLLESLKIEEENAQKDFELFVKRKVEISAGDNFISNSQVEKILGNLVERSEIALRECQLIESLDKQLRLISETQTALAQLKELNELNESILNTHNLSELVPLALKWKALNGSEILNLSESYETVKTFINEQLPEKIDAEIEGILASWTDDIESRDSESISLLSTQLRLDSANPLHGLFASYPLSKLKGLLKYHEQLGLVKTLQRQFPERLLNRLYDILQVKTATVQPFSVGQIEALVPEKMKFATRISCILESTAMFIKLHPDLSPNFMEKCGQILRQVRKCAKEERGYEKKSGNAAILDAQLNEVCLIIATINGFIQNVTNTHSDDTQTNDQIRTEISKWKCIYKELEEIYLAKGIQQAIEMDQIVSDNEFPVSSCVDDIFYVLKAARSRSDQIRQDATLISNSLNEFFLNVLKKHLETLIQNLKPLNLVELASPFRPSRELISTLVLVNNLVATRSNWKVFAHDSDSASAVESEIQSILNFALSGGIHEKVLQSSVKKELKLVKPGEDLFIKIHSLITTIYNLFKVLRYKEYLVINGCFRVLWLRRL